MLKEQRPKKPIFYKAVGGTILCLIFGIQMFTQQEKTKAELSKTEGTIISISDHHEGVTNKMEGTHRFIRLDSSAQVFVLRRDTDPEYEILDSLHPGDYISLFYEGGIPANYINTKTRYVDRDTKPFYINESNSRTGGMILLFLSVFILGLVLYLKAAGKII
jgi:hypothetical protein